jgi:acyl-CoA synthetase (AMP-forming)/AMP-acid ligase II
MGDTGSFDTAGRFWIAGRVHSTIHRRGGPVHPQLVEQAAKGEDDRIRRLAAVGLDDPLGDERAVLVVEVVETGSAADLMRDIAARLAAAGLEVDDVIFTREPLPVDPRHNSKIDYPRLRKNLVGE